MSGLMADPSFVKIVQEIQVLGWRVVVKDDECVLQADPNKLMAHMGDQRVQTVLQLLLQMQASHVSCRLVCFVMIIVIGWLM